MSSYLHDIDRAKVPAHVAIVMDGNGRWAKQRGLPRTAGHTAGEKALFDTIEGALEVGLKWLTIYAFSTENWSRPRSEVFGLMRLLREAIDRETESLHRNGVQVRHIGQLAGLSPQLARSIRKATELTKDNRRITLNVAFNYGGRAEILDAVRRLIASGVPEHEISEDLFARYLYTACQPDPDLIIRTGGEMRLSNFLIWQAAYAEYYATPVYWPDFSKEGLQGALLAYAHRERRFGKV